MGYIKWFKDISIDDVPLVGGKNASLGEMYHHLSFQNIKIPNGFAITAEAYRDMLDSAGAWDKIHNLLDKLNPNDVELLSLQGKVIRHLIYNIGISDKLRTEILAAYHELQKQYGEDLSVAVRSSATAEDLPNASFAGQHDTYLNIQGDTALLDACRHCFASLFTDRAITYRINNNFDHFKVALSISIMKMVRSDLAASGVMFSLDTESGFRDVVYITGAYGLGENIVQGLIDPDEFYVHKPTFQQGYRSVLQHILGAKRLKMIYSEKPGESIRNISTPDIDRTQYCISDQEVLKLADYAIKTEAHYSDKAGKPVPMDMEWAKDGIDGELYLIQARPETVASLRPTNIHKTYQMQQKGDVILTGRAIGNQVAIGKVRKIFSPDELYDFRPGEVLVAENTRPDWGPVMKAAGAIITDRGGRTCHAAIVARELGIPAIVGAHEATDTLQNGMLVTVSCAEGNTGKIYTGKLDFNEQVIHLDNLPKPKTELMLNVGTPERAFALSGLPCDGVGLARMEFIISETIKAHPLALLKPDKIKDRSQRQQLKTLIADYNSGADYFIEKLSEGIGMIAAAFYPRPVIARLSDFKTNEYANLIGGRDFEPLEENPMLGFRGAARYAHPLYADGFALECLAIKHVRQTMGMNNLKVMVPFCRRVQEAEAVLSTMQKHGLVRGEHGLEVYMMCEIPNNILLIDEFAKLFDGFSIGSNDLTQLVLGVDRDSETVAFDFDERDPGVLKMIRMAIEGARRNHCYSGICGQAPSDYPEIAEYLVKLGIDSISLNPDTLVDTLHRIYQLENKLTLVDPAQPATAE